MKRISAGALIAIAIVIGSFGLALAASGLTVSANAAQVLQVNRGFESGDFTGWAQATQGWRVVQLSDGSHVARFSYQNTGSGTVGSTLCSAVYKFGTSITTLVGGGKFRVLSAPATGNAQFGVRLIQTAGMESDPYPMDSTGLEDGAWHSIAYTAYPMATFRWTAWCVKVRTQPHSTFTMQVDNASLLKH